MPPGTADVAILEEPEHLTWYYHGDRWTDKFSSVVGVVHTNYIDYVRREKFGDVKAKAMEVLNNWMVRCYCDKVNSLPSFNIYVYVCVCSSICMYLCVCI